MDPRAVQDRTLLMESGLFVHPLCQALRRICLIFRFEVEQRSPTSKARRDGGASQNVPGISCWHT